MRKHTERTAVVLAVALMIVLASCGTAPAGSINEERNNTAGSSQHPVSASGSEELKQRELYELNDSKTVIIAEVKDKSDGGTNIGIYADGLPKEGIESLLLKCEPIYILNYERLRQAADNEDALYHYFNIGQFAWVGGGSEAKRLESKPDGIFKGDVTEEFLEGLKRNGTTFTYALYLDQRFGSLIDTGDVVIAAIDPQVSINPNSMGNVYRIKDAKTYNAVIAPFSMEQLSPFTAKFESGRLVLPENLQDAFELRRLYNDTNPGLTGIKDGDSIENVVAFLKAVQQDMARYEAELKQLPASTDVSSIR